MRPDRPMRIGIGTRGKRHQSCIHGLTSLARRLRKLRAMEYFHDGNAAARQMPAETRRACLCREARPRMEGTTGHAAARARYPLPAARPREAGAQRGADAEPSGAPRGAAAAPCQDREVHRGGAPARSRAPPGGITVSTLGEAEHFFAHGITDILYAVGIAPAKLAARRPSSGGAAPTCRSSSTARSRARGVAAQRRSARRCASRR